MINPDTNTACNNKTPNPNADQPEPQATNRKTLTQIQTPLATKPDLINSPFTSFEEVRARRQTAQSQYVRTQLFKSIFGKEERREKKRFI
jgi:hypothetical protein